MKVKVVIEIRRGCVENIISNEDIDIVLVDHDNLEEVDDESDINIQLDTYSPDQILSTVDVDRFVDDQIKIYSKFLAD